MIKRLPVMIAMCLVAANVTFGRVMNRPDYKEMTEKADLIVIATPTSNVDLPGETTIPNVISQDTTGNKHLIPAIQVETTFRAVAVLKGTLPGKAESFKLLHLRFSDPVADGNGMNVPMLVSFKPEEGEQYLLFLKMGANGAYEPFNGQTDPAVSVEKLQQRAVAQK